MAQLAATAECSVLIVGPTGTGKDVLAEDIHNHSARARRRFVAVNCAALSMGLFESELFGHARGAYTGATASKVGLVELASGGTLFLDEVGELSLEGQSKLLRFLAKGTFWPLGAAEERSADVRVIAATNRNLAALLDSSFRADLFFRLSVLTLVVPPLEREDVRALARAFAAEIAGRRRGSPEPREIEAIAELASAKSFRGGARELRNAIERYFLIRDTARRAEENWRAAVALDLLGSQRPDADGAPTDAADHRAAVQQLDDLLFLLAARDAGNVRALCQRLDRSQQYVYSRLKQLGLRPNELKRAEIVDRAVSTARGALLPHRALFQQLLNDF